MESLSLEKQQKCSSEFKEFVDKCPSPYHVCQYMREKLLAAGYTEINERKIWPENVKKGFVIRDYRSIIAFNVKNLNQAIIATAHNDFQSVKIIQRHEMQKVNEYVECVQNYGVPIFDSYADRSLRIAGLLSYVNEDNKLNFKLVDSVKGVASFPNLAIHLRGKGYGPRFEPSETYVSLGHTSIDDLLVKMSGIPSDKIRDHDLYLVDSEPSGGFADLITAGRIDDFCSCYSILSALLNESGDSNSATQIMAIFDRSLNGGDSVAGNNGTFLEDVLDYIFDDKLDEVRARTMLLTCDHCEANHPSFPDYYNPDQPIYISKGAAIKRSLRSDLATDDTTSFIVEAAANKIGIPVQYFQCRNMQIMTPSCGTNITTNSGLRTADIGLPILAIGSLRQTASAIDLYNYRQLITEIISNYTTYYNMCSEF